MNANQEFRELMDNTKYWENVVVDKGESKVIHSTAVVTNDDLESELSDMYIDDLYETSLLVEEAMKEHSLKRNNRKYQASRKYLIKDKRNLFLKGFRQMYQTRTPDFLDPRLDDLNVLKIENLMIFNSHNTSKISEFPIIDLNLYYYEAVLDASWNFKRGNLISLKERGYFIPSRYDVDLTFVPLSKSKSNIKIRKDFIESISFKEVSYLPPVKKPRPKGRGF